MLSRLFSDLPLYDPALYNCTRTSPYTESKVAIGIVYMSIGCIAQILYVFVLLAIYRTHSLWMYPCYRIMFFLGIPDMLCLIFCADFAGFYSIVGLHPCFNISFTVVTGCITFGLWHMSCCYVLILAFNRTCELVAPRKCGFLFKGKCSWVVFSLPILYFVYFAFFTKPTFFQPSVSAFLLNPMSRATEKFDPDLYTVEAYVFNNFFVMFFLGTNYALICTYLICQTYYTQMEKTSKLVRQVTYQSLIVCSCHFVGCFLYVYIQYFEMPPFFNVVCHLAWIGNHSLPPVVYICFNPSIQTRFRAFFLKSTSKNSSVRLISTVPVSIPYLVSNRVQTL